METVLTYDEYRATRYFRALDGFRAVSILLVVFFHATGAGALHGALGVTIFFVISGFLITTLALREEDRYGAVSLSAFYIRRACRILPLYYIVLVFYILLAVGANYHNHRHLLLSVLPYYTVYLNDLAPHLDQAPFAISWSLGVEEKFYLAWPLLGFVLWRRHPSGRTATILLAIFVPFVLDRFGLLPSVKIYNSPLYYSYAAILVGCLLALALHRSGTFNVLRRFGGGVGAVSALAILVIAHLEQPVNAWTEFAYPFAVALAMISIVLGDAPWVRLLSTRPMVYTGIRSYGIYLVHGFCLSVVSAIVARSLGVNGTATFIFGFAISLVVAAILNLAVERRFITVGRRLTRRVAHEEPIAPRRMPMRSAEGFEVSPALQNSDTATTPARESATAPVPLPDGPDAG